MSWKPLRWALNTLILTLMDSVEVLVPLRRSRLRCAHNDY